ncbi:TraR/DksA C4-type zinc finger protein [Conexibacter sp. JD483]|uniref:TraR/DksA C4-type zinc finger protein n=1 Tax=unclassified Conexibacter TaxID=2627773 RepID=UPI0027236CAA|nr:MULTISPECIES: TraR/DksA C4-type zinc finger protein [unclassified Conexibacter]MDO8187110.1 TraR/DksA C4-type zinc finger protein [Conexibacter sp. CPCC 205706]MDO8200286.1 TraR/DksA C4-type zinc finger protein [Conexibacter sp. CPCC 205762]MDR9368918.1 TraR/DksA C4-type zinc finger protein [Conexibacter sp. JD483]
MDLDHARQLLARERDRVERELTALRAGDGEEEELSHVDQHIADSGTELFERERDAGLVEQLEQQLAAIARAEARIDDGSFGRSVESGEPIPDARLEAMPWAERTVEEQAAFERR